MTGFKQTEIGIIPQDWTVGTLASINEEKKENINPSKFPDEVFEYYSIPAYQNGRVQVLEKGANIFSQKVLLKDGAVLFGKLNPRVEKVWKVSSSSRHRKIGSTEWLVLFPKKDVIAPDYLYYVQWSGYVMLKAKGLVAGSTPSRQRVDPSAFYKLQIPIPSLSEQSSIAYILSKVQSAIETQEKIIEKTTGLKKTLMQKLFTEGLRGEKQKETEIGRVPKSWEIVKFAAAVSYIDYGFSQAIPKTPIKDGIKIVSTADISKDGKLLYYKIRNITAPAKTISRLTLKDGDMLFNWRNTAELIGKTAIFKSQPQPYIFASFILRIRCDEKKSHNLFLCYLMNHFREKGVFVKLSRRAVNQANYNKNEISVLPIPLPTYQEQVEIAEALSTVERKIDSSKSIKAKYESLFASALHHLMTGQIRVKDVRFS
ncbi:MAG TPA: restriction endonuclease subunit S [Sedimentisphaerales bacterium]|nr:restriction endonuclease subunit S [Sedimentisphaerales bacterium]